MRATATTLSLATLLLILPWRDVRAQQPDRVWIPKSRLTNGPHVRAAFRPAVAAASKATVRVRVAGQDAALGGIVGADGWILTKASHVDQPLTCLLRDGRELPARVVGVQRDYDLAMVQVAARGLPVLALERSESPLVGQWVASVGFGRDPVAVGIVGAAARAIPHRSGILGIRLDESVDVSRVVQVFPGTGADAAGILINDVIASVNGIPTPTRQQLIRELYRFSPADTIDVEVERGGRKLLLPAVLSGRLDDQNSRTQYQNTLGSELSQRRFGFPRAFQHDGVLRPDDCGGPVVDLEGRVIGFNVARAGRTESFAVPSSIVMELLYDLMSGNLAPDNS